MCGRGANYVMVPYVYLGSRCYAMTFRDTTERPVTVELGTNFLMADLDPKTVKDQMLKILGGDAKTGSIPPFWDGKTANRICSILYDLYK